MSTIYPAIKGKIGTNYYYVVEMTAKKAAELLTIPKEIKGWEDLAIEEKYQREINYKRVRNDIYKYLYTDPDRFFGSLIVAVDKLTNDDFEPVSDLVTKMPKAYRNEASHIGMLTLQDDGLIVPIDGQHRLAGLKFAIQGRDENGKDIADHKHDQAKVEEDMISLIMLPINLADKNDIKKARKIFTKLNKYARPTNSSQNLITDDDDSIAIISREIANIVINENSKYDLVNCNSSRLSQKDPQFTTLDTVYRCNKTIIKEVAPAGTVTDSKSQERQEEYEHDWLEECREVWDKLLKEINVFKIILSHKGSKKESITNRTDARKEYLLGKPIPQQCLFEAFIRMTHNHIDENINALSPDEAIKRLNKIPWEIGDSTWDGVLWLGTKDKGKILPKGKKLAVDLILYKCNHFPANKVKELKGEYLANFPEVMWEGKELPDRI